MIPSLGEQLYTSVCMIPASIQYSLCMASLQVTCGKSLGTRLSYVPQLYPLSELPGINFDAISVSEQQHTALKMANRKSSEKVCLIV